MEHLQAELDSLRSELSQMLNLVLTQLRRAERAFLSNDRPVVKEIASAEKLVNAMELQIDSRCETVLALFTPVAVDLRFVLSALKINVNVERIGDLADGIGRTVIHSKDSFDKGLLEKVNAYQAFKASLEMFEALIQAYEKEDTLLARDIFAKDKVIDNIVNQAIVTAEDYAKSNPDNFSQAIQLLSIMKMLERVGDHLKNVAEEIIFYSEARVLKHSNKGQNGNNK
jgi:phosphate transport system protein